MSSTVCWKCIEDAYLSNQVKREGVRLKCSVCDKTRKSFSVERIAEVLDPILREHIMPGREVSSIGQGDDDHIYYEQQGDPLSYWVQEVLGQPFDNFDEEIVDALVAGEFVHPSDGDIPFYDSAADYESTPVSVDEYHEEWDFALRELKHSRRFFSSAAQALFARVFRGVETMKSYGEGNKEESVVLDLPEGSKLYRARTCDSLARLNELYAKPLESVGPPPPSRARAGRMNAEGVVVFYGATDRETCLAEMRPALGGDTALIELQTTKPLRMIDFTRLEKSHGEGLSYFQPDFTVEVERRKFIRRLHSLISQPVVPGREADYLITQTMAEYLAHVHKDPFHGILFKSVQQAGGINAVLFAERRLDAGKARFPITYVGGSFKLFTTKAIQYHHRERHLWEDAGKVELSYDEEYDDFYDETE